MRTITLDLERMTSVPAIHKYLRSALALPVYYGANLDALYDCLTEIAEPTQIIVPADITDNEKLGWYGGLQHARLDGCPTGGSWCIHIPGYRNHQESTRRYDRPSWQTQYVLP